MGQEHVKDVLRPAIERGRVANAYLFSGPRGVGKTTTARLIAMAVNCEAPDGVVRPCGECPACRDVIAGRHPDVFEIDAASNNSVDDVRDLREKVELQPMRSGRKVYILDEAHMMSKSAFNALLKTLEEPPKHVVFVLATTEPEKLPPTIVSRCQHYRFRRLRADEIKGKLRLLVAREGVQAEDAALALVARAADGAMRDGESLLERLLSSGRGSIGLADVESALGLPPRERISTLAERLLGGDLGEVVALLGGLYRDGFAPRTITERAKIELRDRLFANVDPNALLDDPDLRPLDEPDRSRALALIAALDREDARFVRSADLLALEMAFTQATLAAAPGAAAEAVRPSGESDVAVEPNLLARLERLERSVKGLTAQNAVVKPVTDPATPQEAHPVPAPPKPVTLEVKTNGPARDEPVAQLRANAADAAPGLPDFDPHQRRPAAPEGTRQPVVSDLVGGADGAEREAVEAWKIVLSNSDVVLKSCLQKGRASFDGPRARMSFPAANAASADLARKKRDQILGLLREHYRPDAILEIVDEESGKKASRGPSVKPAVAEAQPGPVAGRPAPAHRAAPRRPAAAPPLTAGVTDQDFDALGEAEPPVLFTAVAPEPVATEPVVIEAAPLEPAPVESLADALRDATPMFDVTPETTPPGSPAGNWGGETPPWEVGAADELAEVESYLPPELDGAGTAREPLAASAALGGAFLAAASAGVKGHPNYERLVKLFPHKVREFGLIEANVSVEPDAPAVEEAD